MHDVHLYAFVKLSIHSLVIAYLNFSAPWRLLILLYCCNYSAAFNVTREGTSPGMPQRRGDGSRCWSGRWLSGGWRAWPARVCARVCVGGRWVARACALYTVDIIVLHLSKSSFLRTIWRHD